jgi:hypothetical protein
MLPLGWRGFHMRYSILQLFLARRVKQADLFSTLEPIRTRQQFLSDAFSTETRFEHWKKPYVFKPFPSPDPAYVVGVIAKEHLVTVAGPPEEEFANKQVEDWDTANVLIDTSSTEQLAAMQPAVGVAVQIFRSLIDHINNANPTAEWMIAVNPVTTKEQFWGVAEKYKGHIAEIDLSFAVPNIWGGQSETEKALNELKTESNAQEVEVKIKNRDGQLNPDSARLRQSVEYISHGGGTAKLRDDTNNTIFSTDSEENIVTTAIEPDFPIQSADEGMITSLIKRLFGK